MTTKSTAAIVLFSMLVAIGLCEVFGEAWEDHLRFNIYNSVLQQPVPSTYHVYTDSCGIPYIEYESSGKIKPGKRYMPTTIAIYGLQYLEEYRANKNISMEKKFLHCAEWLLNNLTVRHNYALYEFTWQQPYYPLVKTPWRSGLSSGHAIDLFISAHQLTGNEKYFNSAKLLLNGFYVSIQDGGFTYKQDNGWWFEEYADTGLLTPHVINGHIYAMLGVYNLWQTTKSDSAKFVYDRGLAALKFNLQNYDAGDGWSYYDRFKKKSDKQYQQTMVDLMKLLYNTTGDKIFYSYYKKWKSPLDEIYFVTVIKEKNRTGLLLLLMLFVASTSIALALYKAYCQKYLQHPTCNR